MFSRPQERYHSHIRKAQAARKSVKLFKRLKAEGKYSHHIQSAIWGAIAEFRWEIMCAKLERRQHPHCFA